MEVTVYQKMPDSLQAMAVLGEVFYRSGMFNIERPEQGQVFALACLCEQKNPFELLRTYHCIQGRLTKRADAMLAEFKTKSGKCKWISKLNDVNSAKALFVFGENEIEAEYTIEDAKREGLTGKGVWQKSPADMLRARLISKVMRMIAPEIVAGVYAPEELGGFIDATATALPPREELLPPKPKVTTPAPVAVPRNITPISQGESREQEPPDEATRRDFLLKSNLIALCGSREDAVNKFLRGNGYITPEQTFLDAADEVKKSIVERTENFFNAVTEYCNANP